MCAVWSAHACYVIYDDGDSKLSLTQQIEIDTTTIKDTVSGECPASKGYYYRGKVQAIV